MFFRGKVCYAEGLLCGRFTIRQWYIFYCYNIYYLMILRSVTALIGPNYSNEAEKTSYLLSSQRTDDRLLQLGLSSTAASLSNSDIYSNFYRVVPSDTIQTEV